MYNVLVVDDEVWMCEGFKKVINKLDCGFTVIDTSRDGRQALTKLENNKQIDVVVTDIHMPIMSGLELMEEMKSRSLPQPVIVISAHNDFEYARTAMRYGAVDYLLKPINNDEIYDVLTNLKEQLNPKDNKEDKVDIAEVNGGVELVKSVLSIIEHSYMEDLSLSVLADQAGFNSSYLSRLFKLETGAGFVQYLRNVRMKHACRLLKKTELTNKDVAKEVGFWDEKHFRRTFKKDIGLTPGEYREKVKLEDSHTNI
ncbi:response regulator [Metabacillus niabensis]|uniref:response regulator transcription factor n=1 Tax=Metabacillus niabensis TaxID=324854 RepID=UPI001CFC089F|nr:response regulator [Metabacillus niabensis]